MTEASKTSALNELLETVIAHCEKQKNRVLNSSSIKGGDCGVVHCSAQCVTCRVTPIVGIRYKCAICPDVDLCEQCEEKNTHTVDHPLIKIRVPKSLPKQQKCFAKFIANMTFPDRSHLAPGESKQKIWQAQNVGKSSFPPGTKLVCLSGENAVDPASLQVAIPQVPAGEVFEISVTVVAPKIPGRYVSYFRLVDGEGERFGPRFWFDFYVPEPCGRKPQDDIQIQESPEAAKYVAQLKELALMGFHDQKLNLYLLEQMDGKVCSVVHWLLEKARSS